LRGRLLLPHRVLVEDGLQARAKPRHEEQREQERSDDQQAGNAAEDRKDHERLVALEDFPALAGKFPAAG
jgi:hypothetical protein